MKTPDKAGHFGAFGGRYVPETLMAPLKELERAYLSIRKDPLFQRELKALPEELCGKTHAPLLCQRTYREVRRG